MRPTLISMLLLALAALASPRPAFADDAAFSAAAAQLASDDFATKEEAVRKVAGAAARRTASRCSPRSSTAAYSRAMRTSTSSSSTSADDGSAGAHRSADAEGRRAPAKPDELTKITTNNRLRKTLRGAIASFDLADPDADVRLAAVKELLRSLDEDTIALLRDADHEGERRATSAQAIEAGLALADLQQRGREDAPGRGERAEGSLNPDVYNALASIATPSADGSYAEPDERRAQRGARAAMRTIDRWRAVLFRRSKRCSSA